MFKWIIAGVVVVLLVIGGFVVYPVTEITAENIQITGVKDVSLRGFTLVGTVYVNNPSIFTILVTSADYQLVLEQTNEVLFSGELPAFVLDASKTTVVPFTMTVKLRSTADFALLAISQKQVNAKISGTAHADVFGFAYDAPFESEIDLKEMLAGALPQI